MTRIGGTNWAAKGARWAALLEPIAAPMAGLLVALVASAIVLRGMGFNPFAVAGSAFANTFGNPFSGDGLNGFGIGNGLREASLLVFPALAVAFGFQAGLFNIGAEGQLFVAAFCVAAAGLALDGASPWLALPILFLVAAGAGAAWALLPGLIRAYRGGHEVISTIMLNFIAFAMVDIFLSPDSSLVLEGTVQTRRVDEAFRVASFERMGVEFFSGSFINLATLLSLPALAFYGWFVWRTRPGLHFRVVGAAPLAAEAAGIDAKRHIVAAMLLSGAFAGLMAMDEVLGSGGSFGKDTQRGLGYTAIAAALLGRCRPVGILLACLFFGFLSQVGIGLQSMRVPREITSILQAFVILGVVGSPYLVTRWKMRLAAKAAGSGLSG